MSASGSFDRPLGVDQSRSSSGSVRPLRASRECASDGRSFDVIGHSIDAKFWTVRRAHDS